MLQAGTGLSTLQDSVESARVAALEAMERLSAAGKSTADAVLVFTSGDHSGSFTPMLQQIRKVCGTGTLAGCTGAGVLTEKGEIEGGRAVAVCAISSDALQVRPFFIRDLKGRDGDVGRQIGDLVRPLQGENALLVIFPDTLSCEPDELFGGIQTVAGPAPLVGGGAAAGGPTSGETYQFCGGDAVTNAVSGLVLTGRIVSTVGVTQSCLPLGRAWRITEAEGNAIRALDGIPAVQALVECLSGPGEAVSRDLDRLAPHLFVAFPVEQTSAARRMKRGHYYVRNILGVSKEDGAIVVGREAKVGDVVSFAVRDPQGAREDLKTMLEESLPGAGSPGLGLYFNCAGRGEGLYGVPGIDSSYIGNACPEMPLIGFFGYAEIASAAGRGRLHNYSGVMTLITEAPSVS